MNIKFENRLERYSFRYMRNNKYSKKMASYHRIKNRIDKFELNKEKYILNLHVGTAKYGKVSDIDWGEQNQKRAGVIPYVNYEGEILFCLGRDTSSYNLTDFGGGVKKEDRNPIEGGLREFREESLNVFGEIDITNIKDNIVVYCQNMMIIFVEFKVNPRIIIEKFKSRVQKEKNPEVCDITWISKDEMLQIIQKWRNHRLDKIMYSRVRKLLNKTVNVIEQLD